MLQKEEEPERKGQAFLEDYGSSGLSLDVKHGNAS